ncbi:mechanosensitive ion channel family protein [Meridianimarinicoccus aquatilis]|uniref:Small-conductance mechanosensitive channel n=1 Tax=Meridianimarinicoccus aquatilis TaxID=2552766 RepID=A0A4R6B4L5_9RHOB|nr:mechanosensitive ion channel family protein [Fluviibacterium aquatile]TDL91394.1 mechanosensitive ion channel family protein [Fluviibacterium aquatile]
MKNIVTALLLVLGLVLAMPLQAQDAAEPAAEEGPTFPAVLTDTGLSIEEMKLRLIPLTVDQLEALAQEWLGIVQTQTQAVADAQIAVLNAGDNAPDALRTRVEELSDERQRGFARYSLVVDGYQKKGGDEATVDQFRAYRTAIIVEEKQNADLQTLATQALRWATQRDGGIQLGIQVGTVVAAFLGLLIVAKTVRGFARRGFGKVRNLSKLLQAFLSLVVYWITMAFGLMIVLSMLGIDITPVFALVGGLSFIVAFAFQDTLGNLAAGLMIMFNRPFDEGDYVTVAGTGGTVKSVSVVSTTVTTPDNQVIVIPNSKVWGDVITNVTASTTRRVDLVFGISYEDSIADAQRILEEVVHAHPLVLSDPEPVIRVNALGASSVDFICRPWARSADYWSIYWDLTRQVKEAFDAAGISIPYPQTDMHLHVRNAAAAATLTGPEASGDGIGRPKGAPDFGTGDDGADADSGDGRD